MYTDLPKVNPIAEILKTEANKTQTIKIKLLRANIFTLDGLQQFPISDPFEICSVDIGVDRIISLISRTPLDYLAVLDMIEKAFVLYLKQRYDLLTSILLQEELEFLMSRPGRFFTVEFLSMGYYIVRI